MYFYMCALILSLIPKCVVSIPINKSFCLGTLEYVIKDNCLHGTILLKDLNSDSVELKVKYFIKNVSMAEGKLELASSRNDTIKAYTEEKTISFNISIPVLEGEGYPRISKIFLNNEEICKSDQVKEADEKEMTLQHFFDVKEPELSIIKLQTFKNYNQFPVNTQVSKRNRINFRPKSPTYFSRQQTQSSYLPYFMTNEQQNFLNFRSNPDVEESAEEEEPFTVIFDHEETTTVPKTAHEDICGRPVTTNSLILEGNVVPKGAYPWLAAIFRVTNTGLNYICSGSLISNKHVVTAAHCVMSDQKALKPQDFLIIMGKLNIAKWVPTNGEIFMEPSNIYVHPDYVQTSSDADIAVLELTEAISFSSTILPICLWQRSNDLNSIIGNKGIVAGWGKNEEGLTSAEPRQTSLPVIEQETCLRSSHQFQYITSNRTFCAGLRDGSGPCNGDSGSGFIMKKNNVWMLRGIVSMSISDTYSRTCDLKHYVVFTDASKYVSWLMSFIKN